MGVSMIFFFSWAPLNIFNIVDLFVNGNEGTSLHVGIFSRFFMKVFYIMWNPQETMLILFTVFHFCAMSSVCSNPIM